VYQCVGPFLAILELQKALWAAVSVVMQEEVIVVRLKGERVGECRLFGSGADADGGYCSWIADWIWMLVAGGAEADRSVGGRLLFGLWC
jgi:hypothetical protein